MAGGTGEKTQFEDDLVDTGLLVLYLRDLRQVCPERNSSKAKKIEEKKTSGQL